MSYQIPQPPHHTSLLTQPAPSNIRKQSKAKQISPRLPHSRPQALLHRDNVAHSGQAFVDPRILRFSKNSAIFVSRSTATRLREEWVCCTLLCPFLKLRLLDRRVAGGRVGNCISFPCGGGRRVGWLQQGEPGMGMGMTPKHAMG